VVRDSAGSLGFVREVGKTADERRVDIGRRLGPRVVGTVVRVRVALVGPADDGASEHVGVGGAGVVVALEPLLASDARRVAAHRRQGRAAVVDPPRPPRAVVHHIQHAQRVVAEDVVHLSLGELPERRGRDAEAGAGALGDGHVLGVGGEQEARGGDVLQVGVARLVHQPARRVLRCGGRRVGLDPAEEVRLLPERIELLVPVHQSPLFCFHVTHAREQVVAEEGVARS
jgi:hypothetical protein